MANQTELRIVAGHQLPRKYRDLLRPGELVTDTEGVQRRLPRFFYEVDSWRQALDTMLTPHFALAELMLVDCLEAEELLRHHPHYVPLAVGVFARYLEDFREKTGDEKIYISANGGYRSPSHRLTVKHGVHNWGTAANIYRIGDTHLDDQASIEKYADIFCSLGAEAYAAPYGSGAGQTDDHLHVDIGFVSISPRKMSEE
jgi:hypothetical protein